ncbi:hypothetical protein GCM10015535_06820 [Streptomyces gelaticus]|uniref:Uncharacterized protein n=1 Tax=Streptomyces gelaticus TaxID=285446 RepID=A0ABQ2VRM8_9ACTN|nr:hypothetical protein GCM10015535_06820 [Streptomyces gelaticus]
MKVFPSVSERWADASIASLRTQGAFLVDADRSGGATRWVRVHSEAGAPLVLDHSIRGRSEVRDARGRPLHWRETGPGRITVSLPRGSTAVVTPHGSRHPRTRGLDPLGPAGVGPVRRIGVGQALGPAPPQPRRARRIARWGMPASGNSGPYAS